MTDEPDFANKRAPSRDYINSIDDVTSLIEIIDEASDVEIAIETQLDYYSDDPELKGRRINALIYWRQATKRAKRRITMIQATARAVVA